MRYRLPNMNALRVFAVAGRHLSFKAAAAELRITPHKLLVQDQNHPVMAGREIAKPGARFLIRAVIDAAGEVASVTVYID